MINKAILPSLEKHLRQVLGESAEEALEEITTQLMGMAGKFNMG
jgi:hypothetical protein